MRLGPYAYGNPAAMGAPFTPASIPSLVTQFSKSGPFFTTAAGSTPASAIGDPVGRWEGLVGGNATQATAAQRPLRGDKSGAAFGVSGPGAGWSDLGLALATPRTLAADFAAYFVGGMGTATFEWAGDYGLCRLVNFGGADGLYAVDDSNAVFNSVHAAVNPTTPKWFYVRKKADGSVWFAADGVAEFRMGAGVSTNPFTFARILTDPTNASSATGADLISAMLLFSADLTAGQHTALQAWLAANEY